jgi:hypothetical protein
MKTPQLLPTIPMERYGLNPMGRALYRVVWSDSRTYLLGGNWGGGSFEMRESELYEGVHAWILEKWQSAEQYAGSREEWDAKERDPSTPSLGPYPSEGEYVYAYTFPFEPTHSMISIWIRANSATMNLSAKERKDAIMSPLLARQSKAHARIDDIFDESQPAFRYADAAISMSTAGSRNIHVKPPKRIKDVEFRHSVEDLGMPMSDNAFFTGDTKNGSSSSGPHPGQ